MDYKLQNKKVIGMSTKLSEKEINELKEIIQKEIELGNCQLYSLTDITNDNYLITETNFDNDENSIGKAIHVDILGYVTSKKLAENKIQELDNKSKKYTSWEGKINNVKNDYPKFEMIKIKQL